jgi:hypothetical protein
MIGVHHMDVGIVEVRPSDQKSSNPIHLVAELDKVHDVVGAVQMRIYNVASQTFVIENPGTGCCRRISQTLRPEASSCRADITFWTSKKGPFSSCSAFLYLVLVIFIFCARLIDHLDSVTILFVFIV